MTTRAAALFALALLLTAVPIVAQTYGLGRNGNAMVDFKAYYCAARAVREHKDPYHVDALHPCEAKAAPQGYYRAPPHLTVPAPYPPYVLAALAPLTMLSFPVASLVWWGLLAAFFCIAAALLASVVRVPLHVAWAACALSLGLSSLPTGEIVPACIAAILGAAWCLQRGRYIGAALCAAASTIEPHLGLPACVALFWFVPQTRVMLVFAGAAIAASSLAASGVQTNLEYVLRVIPAHALSEVSRDNQYSLSTVLTSFGVRDLLAVRLGSLSYAVMLIIGVILGRSAAKRYLEPAFVPLLPVALTLLGGPFVHTVEIVAAIPAALLFCTRETRYRTACVVVALLLCVPWMEATAITLFLAPIFPVAWMMLYFWPGRVAVSSIAGLAAFAAIVWLFHEAALPFHHVVHAMAQPRIDPRLAEQSWRRFVLSGSTNRPATWYLRAPTWAALVALLGIAALTLRRPHWMMAKHRALRAREGRP